MTEPAVSPPEPNISSPHGEVWVPSPFATARDRARRRETARSAVIAAISTIVFATILVVVVTSSPGWPRVRESFFSWPDATAALPDILRGMWLNVRVMIVCEIFILVIGLLMAVFRTLRSPVAFPLRMLATAYTDTLGDLALGTLGALAAGALVAWWRRKSAADVNVGPTTDPR